MHHQMRLSVQSATPLMFNKVCHARREPHINASLRVGGLYDFIMSLQGILRCFAPLLY